MGCSNDIDTNDEKDLHLNKRNLDSSSDDELGDFEECKSK